MERPLKDQGEAIGTNFTFLKEPRPVGSGLQLLIFSMPGALVAVSFRIGFDRRNGGGLHIRFETYFSVPTVERIGFIRIFGVLDIKVIRAA
jgi:hypothetical protein